LHNKPSSSTAVSVSGRFFAIGDVHGCLEELHGLLARLKLGPADRIVFLGDLINRGPDSLGVLRLVQQLPHAVCVLGNHERRLLRAHQSGDTSQLKAYDWEVFEKLKTADWAFIDRMGLTYKAPHLEVVFVHAGFLPNMSWQNQPVEVVTELQFLDPQTGRWGRRQEVPDGVPWQNCWQGPPFVICGHTPRPEVLRRPWSLCLDTGCVYGGCLTAYEVGSRVLFQEPARANYIGKALVSSDAEYGPELI
jgi:hypothetical protein